MDQGGKTDMVPEIDRECVQISHDYSVSLWTPFSLLAEDPCHNNVIVLTNGFVRYNKCLYTNRQVATCMCLLCFIM